MESLYTILASELKHSFIEQTRTKLRSASNKTQSKLQLNYVPLILDLDYYKDPHSSDNPNGDYKAAYRLYSLSNAASPITSYFENTHSISSVWDSIIHGATSDNAFVSHLLKRAQDIFMNARMAGMGGIPEDWYLVNATPANWYELVQDPANLIRIQIDTPDKDSDFYWNINSSTRVMSDIGSSLEKVYMDVLKVEFSRPWLLTDIFDANWKIQGLDRGYFSSGSDRYNEGVFPLITQSMLVGTNLTIKGNFSEKEMDLISDNSINELSIGPFVIRTNENSAGIAREDSQLRISSKTTQVLGYVSQLIPLCPRDS